MTFKYLNYGTDVLSETQTAITMKMSVRSNGPEKNDLRLIRLRKIIQLTADDVKQNTMLLITAK